MRNALAQMATPNAAAKIAAEIMQLANSDTGKQQ